MRSLEDVETLIAFFEARRGRLFGFRWKDWADYKSAPASIEPDFEDQLIGVGDGETRVFQMVKTYASGLQTYVRPIAKPVLGTISVGIQGDRQTETINYEVDTTTGQIEFASAPDQGVQITAGFEFDVPVRFDTTTSKPVVAVGRRSRFRCPPKSDEWVAGAMAHLGPGTHALPAGG